MHADTDHHPVTGQHLAVHQLHRLSAFNALYPFKRYVQPHINALLPMQFQQGLGHSFRQYSPGQSWPGFQQRYLTAQGPGRCRDFEADKATADDHQARAGHQCAAQGQGFVMGAQVKHVGQRFRHQGQATRSAPGRQQ
ncbi:hypothetical protein D3C80_1815630 [compost metagenome]